MAASQYYFTVTHDQDGHRARFYGNYGRELIWWTQGYNYRQDALTAIALMRQQAATAPLL